MVLIKRIALEDILWWVEMAREDFEEAAKGPPREKTKDFDPTTLAWPRYYKELKAAIGEEWEET